MTGLNNEQLTDLVARLHERCGDKFVSAGPPLALGLFRSVALVVCLMRKNVTQDFAGAVFGVSQATVSRRCDLLRPLIGDALADVVPNPREVIGRGNGGRSGLRRRRGNRHRPVQAIPRHRPQHRPGRVLPRPTQNGPIGHCARHAGAVAQRRSVGEPSRSTPAPWARKARSVEDDVVDLPRARDRSTALVDAYVGI